jgi:hypothetical protein
MIIVGERVRDAPNDKLELPANVAAIPPGGGGESECGLGGQRLLQ